MIAALLLQAAVAAAAPAPVAPAWTITDRTSAAGIRSVSAGVIGDDGQSRFVVKCDIAAEPIVSVQFLQPHPLGNGTSKPVAVRFDDGPAFTADWSAPPNGLYVTDPQMVTDLTRFLVKAKTVRVETTNAVNFAVQATFLAPPGEAMIRRVLDACHYTLGVVPPAPPPGKNTG